MTKKLLLSLTALTLPFAAAHANAAPTLSGEAVFELQLEHDIDSDNNDERTNTFWRTEVAPTLQINEHFFVDGVAVLEPVQDSTAGEDAFMENEGIFIEELKLNYERDNWGVFAGKFNPSFGIAWDFGRGIWSEDFAEDYEITEKLGFGGSYTIESSNNMAHTFSASTFFADTTFLTHSTVTGRGDVDKADGGASNTEDFSSFALSVDGENIAGIENLSYHLGFRHLAEGDANIGGDDEQGFAANVHYVIPVNKNIESDILLEYVTINNVDGGADDSHYYTASIVNTINEQWNVTFGYTKRDLDVAGGTDVNDHLFQLSGGYDFGNGLTAELGWKNTEESNANTDVIGGLLRYTLEF